MAGAAARTRLLLAAVAMTVAALSCAPAAPLKPGPSRYEILLKRGDGFYFNERYREAVGEYTRAAELEGGRAEAFRSRGNAFMALEEYERAQEDFQRALARAPDYAEAHLGLGILFYRLGKYGEAIEELQAATAIDPWNSTARYYTALACEKVGRLREAVEAYKGYIHCAVPRDDAAVRHARERIRELEGSPLR